MIESKMNKKHTSSGHRTTLSSGMLLIWLLAGTTTVLECPMRDFGGVNLLLFAGQKPVQ